MATRIRVRAFVSFLTTFSFLAMAFSGVMLYVAPRGREANWGGWRVLGLGKHTWGGVHMTASLLFVLAAAAHVYFNRKVLWSYVRRKTQGAMGLTGELALALAVTGLVVVGTIAGAPPFRAIPRWNDDIKAYWARSSARAPVPHAEELSLSEFAEHIGLTTDETTAALRKEGFAVADPSMTVDEVASQKGVSPEACLRDDSRAPQPEPRWCISMGDRSAQFDARSNSATNSACGMRDSSWASTAA